MSRWTRRQCAQNSTCLTQSTSKTSVQKNTLEDVELGLLIVRQLQIVMTITKCRHNIAVRRKIPHFILIVFLLERSSENPAAVEFNPTVHFTTIMHPVPTFDTVKIPCGAIHCRLCRSLCKTLTFVLSSKHNRCLMITILVLPASRREPITSINRNTSLYIHCVFTPTI